MKYAATDEIIALRLSEGDDIGDCIAHVCRACDVDSAVVYSAAGMVSSVIFGWYNGRDYNIETVKEIMELTALSGNVSYRGGALYPHLHGVFNKPDHAAISGHILQAVVFNNAEIFLKPLVTVTLARAFDGSFEALAPQKKL
ncbi:MAG: PPC domain-containing DNA-binding protein [Aminivibrio sp.]|nr:DNA-binding protein [Synergistaceae bacterium]